MMAIWTPLPGFFILVLNLAGNHGLVNYCSSDKRPVVHFCQVDEVNNVTTAYFNTGSAPLAQQVNCLCTVKQTDGHPLSAYFSSIGRLYPGDNIEIKINGKPLTSSAQYTGWQVEIIFSKNESATSGTCIKIESTKSRFNISCKTAKEITTETTAQDTQPPTGDTITAETNAPVTIEAVAVVTTEVTGDSDKVPLIAGLVVGGLAVIVLITIAVAIIVKRRRRNNDSDKGDKKSEHQEDTEDCYGLQVNPSYERYDADEDSRTKNEVNEEQYESVQDQHDDVINEASGYDYSTCIPSHKRFRSKTAGGTHDDTYDRTNLSALKHVDETYDHTNLAKSKHVDETYDHTNLAKSKRVDETYDHTNLAKLDHDDATYDQTTTSTLRPHDNTYDHT